MDWLACNNNQLTSLKTNTALHTLSCDNNRLTALDVSKCKKLKILLCKENPNLKSIIIYKYHIIEQEFLDDITKEYGNIITYK